MKNWSTKSIVLSLIFSLFLLYAFLYARAVQSMPPEGPISEHKEIDNTTNVKHPNSSKIQDPSVDDYGGDEDEEEESEAPNVTDITGDSTSADNNSDDVSVTSTTIQMLKDTEDANNSTKEFKQKSDRKKGNNKKARQKLKSENNTEETVSNLDKIGDGKMEVENSTSKPSAKDSKLMAKMLAKAKADQESLEQFLKPFDPAEVVENKSIFLFETNNDVEELAARTLCAMESAARTNINRRVFLLIR